MHTLKIGTYSVGRVTELQFAPFAATGVLSGGDAGDGRKRHAASCPAASPPTARSS